jgi:formamidopyrimidine-DNA glycosylase
MPEGVEIHKYHDFLSQHILHKSIQSIKILGGRYKKHGAFDYYKELNKECPIKIKNIGTKGKLLYIVLQNNYIIITTLGLMGGWTYYSNKKRKYLFPTLFPGMDNDIVDAYHQRSLNHRNIEIKVRGGRLYFYDSLSFGTFTIVRGEDELQKRLKKLGPDIMHSSTTYKVFKEALLKSRNLGKVIGNVLVDQKTISGMGNYLRADILWVARISPHRKVKTLKERELVKLYKACKLMTVGDYNFAEAVKRGNVKKTDKLPYDYNRVFYVYQEDKNVYGNPVKKEELYEGSQKRFIHWVPKIQK